MSVPGLPNWLTSWIAVGAFVIAVTGFALRWIEFRHARQRKVTIDLSGHFVEENDVGDGYPVCNLEVFNAGAVTVRVRWWYLANGKERFFPGPNNPLAGAAIEPGDVAEHVIDYDDVMHALGNGLEFRAYVMLVGERRIRRSNWFSLSSQAVPTTSTRRLWRSARRLWRRVTRLAKGWFSRRSSRRE